MGAANGTEAEETAQKQGSRSQENRGSVGWGRQGRQCSKQERRCVVMRHLVHSVGRSCGRS